MVIGWLPECSERYIFLIYAQNEKAAVQEFARVKQFFLRKNPLAFSSLNWVCS
jgi:hypothetical protein